MFDDIRSKKIVFIAHCLINQNSFQTEQRYTPPHLPI